MVKDERWCYFLAGFAAGEGCFYYLKRKYFAQFCIDLHVRDRAILKVFQTVLGVGTVATYKCRPSMVRFQVGGIRNARRHVIPFFDKYMLPTHKLKQYLKWRGSVLAHCSSRIRAVKKLGRKK